MNAVPMSANDFATQQVKRFLSRPKGTLFGPIALYLWWRTGITERVARGVTYLEVPRKLERALTQLAQDNIEARDLLTAVAASQLRVPGLISEELGNFVSELLTKKLPDQPAKRGPKPKHDAEERQFIFQTAYVLVNDFGLEPVNGNERSKAEKSKPSASRVVSKAFAANGRRDLTVHLVAEVVSDHRFVSWENALNQAVQNSSKDAGILPRLNWPKP